MPRDITTATKNASSAGHVRKINLVFMDFVSGDLYFTTAPDQVTYNGNDYVGLGALGRISAIEETGEQKASGIRFSVSGVPNAYISVALTEDYQGRDVILWEAYLDENYEIIADPVLLFSGIMDTMDIDTGETTTEITVNAESRLSRWETSSNLRFNDAAQQKRFPGDLGLQFAEQTVGKELVWPKK